MLTDNPELDILDADTVRHYFASYYEVHNETNRALEEAILARDFEEIARHYTWIGEQGINLLIPWKPHSALFDQLAAQARAGRFGGGWLRRARPLSVSIRFQRRIPILDHCEEVVHKGEATGWFILLNDSYYDEALGLTSEGDPDSGTIA
jgi:hypothetical protein